MKRYDSAAKKVATALAIGAAEPARKPPLMHAEMVDGSGRSSTHRIGHNRSGR